MIPIAKPYLGEREADAARDVVLSGWVTQGPKVAQFEKDFAETAGAKHAVAVSSCTTALHLALIGVGVKPGDVVVTVSHSFIATANAVRMCGAEPLFVDIELDTYNMDPDALEAVLVEKCERRENGLYYKEAAKLATGESPLVSLGDRPIGRVAAVVPVHQIGMPADLRRIVEIAKRQELPVVEDAACAIGSRVKFDDEFEPVGKPHGDVACFSLHPRKIVTTGDGGMITTNDEKLDERFRLLRQHGMSVTDAARHGAKKVIVEDYVVTAYNYRLTDIQAAVGIEQLKRLPEIVKRRREIGDWYRSALAQIDWSAAPSEPDYARTNWQSYAVRVLENAPLTRDELMQRLLEKEIASKPGVMNAHAEAPYKAQAWNLPNSDFARANIILLPFFDTITEEQLDAVVSALRER